MEGSGVRLLDNLEPQFPFCVIGITIELTYLVMVELSEINAYKMLNKVLSEK